MWGSLLWLSDWYQESVGDEDEILENTGLGVSDVVGLTFGKTVGAGESG